MSDHDDDEDKPTVVLDISKLKEELAKKNDLSDQLEDLEFAVGADETEQTTTNKLNILLFEFGSPLFETAMKDFPDLHQYTLCKDVKDLSARLKANSYQVVMFNYNGDPKAVNALTKQIKEKFSNIKTVIVAKNLAPDKVKIHQASPSGADAYINLPFDQAKLIETFNSLT
jgi:CheY-like chemotaxis protein